MSEASKTSKRETSPKADGATSSPGSADGISLSDSRDGPTTAPSGPDHARASRSPQRESGGVQLTLDICGLHGEASSKSARLQFALESRCRAALDVNGSPEYELTWKRWAMPWGPPICALRARERRTSGSGCGGWPTPTKGNADGSQMAKDASATGRRPDGSKATVSLNHVAILAGWQTPKTPTGGGQAERKTPGGGLRKLEDQAMLAGWATPKAKDDNRSVEAYQAMLARRGGSRKGITSLQVQAKLAGWPSPMAGTPAQKGYNAAGNTDSSRKTVSLIPGPMPASSPAQTERRDGSPRLNPEFSRWLMGFPDEWGCYAPTETRSCRK